MKKSFIKKIDHLVLTTSNSKRFLDFYEKLGFIIKKDIHRAEMFAGDFKINVHYLGNELQPHALNVQVGSGDLCFEIKGSLIEFKEYLEKLGIIIEEGIVCRHGVAGEMNSIYLRDPEGNLLEFSSYDI